MSTETISICEAHGFFHVVFLSCDQSTKTRRKGKGKRSKARIGRRFKTKSFVPDQTIPVKQTRTMPPTTHDSTTSWLESFNVPNGWVNVSTLENKLCLCQIVHQQAIDCAPIVVSRSLIVQQDFSWMLHVHGHHVNPSAVPLSRIPSYLESETATALLETVSSLHTCIGNPEDKFTQLGKAKKNRQFLSGNGSVVAYVDVGFALCTNAKEQFSCTVLFFV